MQDCIFRKMRLGVAAVFSAWSKTDAGREASQRDLFFFFFPFPPLGYFYKLKIFFPGSSRDRTWAAPRMVWTTGDENETVFLVEAT